MFVLTFIVVVMCMLPMYFYELDYPFAGDHLLFAILSVWLTFHVFALRNSPLNKNLYIKIALIPIMIFLFFYLLRKFNGFMTYADETGLNPLLQNLSVQDLHFVRRYIMIAFQLVALTTLLATAILPVVFLRSVWRDVNNKN